ncbi:MAG TPA: sigma-70 family RNA polymerase sigma factor [Candidatus Anaerofilum excrementigallinarum]|nr:sigma-70 family RNA polymerase sigma factor [Candidatus Anaerofilum excrementigallinarum]
MFEKLIDRYGPRLYGLCRKLCAGEWEAQDLYQETWLRAWKARDRLPEDPGPWLTRICVNLYRDSLRRKKRLRFLPFALGEETPGPLDLLAEEPEDRDGMADLHRAVEELPADQRLALILYYFCGKSVQDTAQALGMPEGTVKSRLARARSKLKGRLEDGG